MTNRLEQLTPVSTRISFALSELTHRALANLVRPLDDTTMGTTAGPTSPSIGFHVWHSGRWADIIQAHLIAVTNEQAPPSTADNQLWVRDGWAARFGVEDIELGYLASGMKASPDELAGLDFGKAELVRGYTEAVFEVTNAVVAGLDDEALNTVCIDPYGRNRDVADVIITHITHIGRHLGMIEALIGLTGRAGTATI